MNADKSLGFHRRLSAFIGVPILISALYAGGPTWLDKVAPLISPPEKKTYLALNGQERAKFEDAFWSTKAISAEEYFRRLQYIDSTFGSGRVGSGANTDQGRVYLALGSPIRVMHLPSSRIFVPVEIWYYDGVPGLLNTELRLIFYRKSNVGFLKLYSPTIDTIRALLLPQAATVGVFGPNDSLTENDIRQVLNVAPAEDEVVSAAVNIAAGIKYSGNDEILGAITSPRTMLGKLPGTQVTSRLITSRPKLDVFQTASDYGVPQLDLRLEATVARELDIEVLDGTLPVYQNNLRFQFSKAEPVIYTHLFDLLPGSYRVIFTLDGKAAPYPLEVKARAAMSAVFRASLSEATDSRHSPFQLDGRKLEPNSSGESVVVWLSEPQKVVWTIRKGTEVVWRNTTGPSRLASVLLPRAGLSEGTYTIEAATTNDSRSAELEIKSRSDSAAQPTLVSYNANLAPAQRLAFIGHQWLLRGKLDEARRNLNASVAKGATDNVQIELARADALAGNLDAARDRVRSVLARAPNTFEALSVLAYVETKLQDYGVAADLYRSALAIQDSPAIREALAEVTRREGGK